MLLDLHKVSVFIRWFARIWASLILSFLLFMVIAHLIGEEDGLRGMTSNDAYTFLFFPIGTMLGLLLAFRWDGIGGLITLLSQLALLVVRPDLLEVGLITMASGPAILYLIYWAISRGKHANQ